MSDYLIDWSSTELNAPTTVAGPNGPVTVDVEMRAGHGDAGRGESHGISYVQSSPGAGSTTLSMAFDAPVHDITFALYDVDEGRSFDDKVTVIATDAAGNVVPVTFEGVSVQTVSGNVIEGDGGNGPTLEDPVTVRIAGPVNRIEILHGNGDSSACTGEIRIGDVQFGAPTALDGIVAGNAGNDLIDVEYTGDPEGDRIDAHDAVLGTVGSNDDLVAAGDGDDTVKAGAGDDTVHGGAGNDRLEGGTGDDHLLGDSGGPGAQVVREGLEWNLEHDAAGFTQETGNVSVAFRTVYERPHSVDTLIADTAQNVRGIDGGGGPVDAHSSLASELYECGQSAQYEMAFSQPVGNVSFRINDIDGDGVVRVQAFDAVGNPIAVDLEGGDRLSMIDTDGLAGADTADSKGGYQPDTSDDYSVLVGIDGPVSKIVVTHGMNGDDDSGINITDVYYDVTTPYEDGPGNDTLLGGEGADLLEGGAWKDYLDGGAGADSISGGDDADVIVGGTDGDTVDGGAGGADDDTLDLRDVGYFRLENLAEDSNGNGMDGIVVLLDDEGRETGRFDFTEIENILGREYVPPDPLDGIVEGDDGANLIDEDYTGDPEGDLIDRPEQVVGGGPIGTDADIVEAGAGDDTILSRAGDDTVRAGDGDDSVEGGVGADSLMGEAGDDAIRGGSGNDAIEGGDGADTLYGEDDRDTFSDLDPGDVVYGGAGGDDFDTLDLTGSIPGGGRYELANVVTDSDGNGIDGDVLYYDDAGNASGTLHFENIEKIVPCFTPGSLVATPCGERRVEDLVAGDKVITRDNGLQEIRWVGRKRLGFEELAHRPHMRPVLIRAGALGRGLPERDMLVSPNHRLLIATDRAALYFEDREVLVAAKHLVDGHGIRAVETLGVEYIHFMFDHHEVVLSDGAWSESFQPGDFSLRGIGNAQRAEIFELFPELEKAGGVEGYGAARRTLKRHEARLLVE